LFFSLPIFVFRLNFSRKTYPRDLFLKSISGLVLWCGFVNFGLAQKSSDNHLDQFMHFKEKVILFQNTNIDSSRIYIDSCMLSALALEERFYLGDVFQLKSRDYFLRSQPDSALIYGKKASEVFQEYPDSMAHYVSEYNLGNIYLALEEQIQALVQFKKVLRIIDENFDAYVRDDEDNINLNRAYCYISIGMVYDHLRDYDKKLQNMLRGIKIASNIKNRESEILQAVTMGNIGQTYSELGDFQLAESYAIAGMEMKKKLGIENSSGYNYQVLANAAFGRKKYDLALRYLKVSDQYFEETKNIGELNNNQLIYVKCYIAQNKVDKALEILLNSERKFDEPGAKRERIEMYLLLNEIYSLRKEFEKANQYLKMATLLKDELYLKTNKDATDEFLSFFDDEENRIDDKLENYKNIQEKDRLQLEMKNRKEKERWIYSFFIVSIISLILVIIVVARGNRRNKRINQVLNYSMDEKEILFREVHHRVKNNFQIISSLLNLQQGIEEDTRSKKVLMDAQGRIQSMSLVHELLYRKNEVKKIDFKTYTNELVSSIIRSYANNKTEIKFTIDCQDESFDLELAVPLGLILNEAVTNSVKYAFTNAEKGVISIDITAAEGHKYLLKIKDNGSGIPEEYINGSKETLGIELINILSNQLGGSAQFINDQGTEVRVEFRVS
jgi:two-component system, sensor histidine kinase PdtaS